MQAKHTPGPWYADKIEDRNAYNVFPHGATSALLTVAGPVHDGAHAYALAAEANARLIAAAPELLEALRGLLSNCCEILGEKRTAEMENAHAVIAKALGAA